VILFNFKSFMKQLLITAALLTAAFGTQAQELKGNADAGKGKNAMCIGCHGIPGYKASFPSVYSAPMIAGQNAKYIENALIAYKSGERKHPTMRATAASLTAQDMADLGAYYANLK
jgi:cytochrome c553